MKSKKNAIQFDGNMYTDFFYLFIYNISIIFCKALLYTNIFRNRITINQKIISNDINILYLTRKWGTKTSMNSELLNTLLEYTNHTNSNVKHLEIDNDVDIANYLLDYFNQNKITHIIYDVRIFINKYGIIGIIDGLKNCHDLSYFCFKFNISQICGLTDLVQPGQRLFAEILTRYNGLIVSWGSVGFHEVRSFKHNRILGPLFLPISKLTMSNFENSSKIETLYDVGTVGTGYEPRLSLLNNLSNLLDKISIKHYFNNEKNLTYLEYLNVYYQSKISINTSWIGDTFPGKMHFTHRNFEILYTGSLLFSQKCFGLNIYLIEGVDYVSYENLDDLFAKIIFYLKNETETDLIRKSGQKKVKDFFNNNFVWEQINYTLKYNNIKPLKN
uniref:glycosyltransferase n=1 Tax=Flavobacterium sp. TaxID=239 RepID=UPI00404A7CC2